MDESSSTFFEVKDYEVFGVGAERKVAIQERHQRQPLKLLRHGRDFLDGIPEHSLAWLQPEIIEEKILHDPKEELRLRFREIFPGGQTLLGDLGTKIVDDYLSEMPWQEGLIDDHFRYFAFFLRTRFPTHQNWQEVFICEWTRWSRRYLDLPWSSRSDTKYFELNPSLQFYRLGAEAAAFVGSVAGLYACFYSEREKKMRECSVQKSQARALDLLEEEMGFSREKVLQVLTEDLGSTDEAQATLQSLVDLGILR